MSTILAFGASSRTSVGFFAGDHLARSGHSVQYASRSGRLGARCDITNAAHVQRLMASVRPDILLCSAGLSLSVMPLGSTTGWSGIKDHLHAKTFGTEVVLDAAVRYGSVGTAIFFGGRVQSSDPRYCAYTIGNSATLAAVRFANKHYGDKFYSWFIDLPLVNGTAMGERFIEENKVDRSRAGSIEIKEMLDAVDAIIRRDHLSEHVVLGADTWFV